MDVILYHALVILAFLTFYKVLTNPANRDTCRLRCAMLHMPLGCDDKGSRYRTSTRNNVFQRNVVCYQRNVVCYQRNVVRCW